MSPQTTTHATYPAPALIIKSRHWAQTAPRDTHFSQRVHTKDKARANLRRFRHPIPRSASMKRAFHRYIRRTLSPQRKNPDPRNRYPGQLPQPHPTPSAVPFTISEHLSNSSTRTISTSGAEPDPEATDPYSFDLFMAGIKNQPVGQDQFSAQGDGTINHTPPVFSIDSKNLAAVHEDPEPSFNDLNLLNSHL